MKNFLWTLVCIFLFAGYTLKGQERMLSPYFYLPDGKECAEAFPLLHTSAEINIAGVIADVRVKQVYKNEGNKTIEAIYVFPGSTNAAVYDMKMRIGERLIQAEIVEKKKARERYQKAKSSGRSASLLEQERPNVFPPHIR